jgi:hypothetical protein
MKLINIKKLTLIGLMTTVLVSACTSDFEQMNVNPNGPVEIPSHLLLPSLIEQTSDLTYNTFNGGDMGECWVQHWGKVQYNDEERYSPRVTSLNDWWDLLYARPLMDARKMAIAAKGEGNNHTLGVAMIWQSYVYSLLTDTFGDIPYGQSLSAEAGITLPAYERQEVIYPAMIDSLEAAVSFFSQGGTIPATQDIMYGGNTEKWIKFANTLRVRLLMRMSGKVDVSAELQNIVDNEPLFESNADNAQLNYLGQNPNANPIWNTVVFTNRLEWRINETMVTIMEGLGDPRLTVYAQPNEDGNIRGCAPGIEEPTTNGYDYANTSMLGEYFLQPSTPAVFMDYAELNFLLAEAAKKGIITGGDATAKAYYDAGITASFTTYNGFENENGSLISLVPAAYLAQTGVTYDPANALEQIGTQKWIALFCQGVEAWTEWRRTQVPALSPALDPIGVDEIPSRYLYPSKEQSLNAANYKAAVQAMGPDELTTKVWWMD